MCAERSKLDGIPYRVIKRLPSYRAALVDAVQAGSDRISSTQLASVCGSTASQVRQDLSHFGTFGQQGYGYAAQDLLATIDRILGIDAECHMALIGVGQLGHALLAHEAFIDKGFRFVVAFDDDPQIVGTFVHGVPVLPTAAIGEQIAAQHVEIGVIAVPKNQAQAAADAFTAARVKGIWNFAPVHLKLPEQVAVERVSLIDSLMTLAFQIKPRAVNRRRRSDDATDPS